MQNRKLILIVGELAAGKSTLANHIAARYGVPAFTKDRIKELLCDGVGFRNRAENLKLSFLTFELLFHIFECCSAAGEPLVLESNFRQNELDRLEVAAANAGYDVLTLSLTGDLHVLHRRFLARIASGTRHAAHQTQDLSRFEDFSAISYAENPRRLFGTVVTIDTTAPDAPFDLSDDARIRAFLA
ncbi:MAG: AAA family ATPase [Clostridia bacterium]|nr:AAA family ATPase [Clostridia bacterium]